MLKRKYFISIVLSVAVALTALVLLAAQYSFKGMGLRVRDRQKEILVNELSLVLADGRNANNVLMRSHVDVFFKLAKIYLEEKDFDKAVVLYEKGLQIDSWRPLRVLELGLAYKNIGLHDAARQRFKQALALRPSLPVFLRAQWELFNAKGKGQIVAEEQVLPIAEGRLKDLTIYILPFGAEDKEMLEDLRVMLQDTFKVRFSMLEPLPGTPPGFGNKRKQYFVEPLLWYVSREYKDLVFNPKTAAILIVTSFDITEQGLNFIFGRTDAVTRSGIFSYNRFLADNPDKAMFFKRVLTQAMSTGGFLLGLPRCSIPGCARSYPHSFFEFKKKSHRLCAECRQNLVIFLERLRACPEVSCEPLDAIRFENVKKKYSIK